VPVDQHPPGDEWGGIGSPGLHHAAVNGHARAVGVLLDAGADVALVDDVYGSQALAWAASGGHGVVVDLLLAAGADPTHHNDHGRTAVGLARDNGFPELADRLDESV
jgi:ankyrin repeat protein